MDNDLRRWMDIVLCEAAMPADITPETLTATIRSVVADWLHSGQVTDCYAIGSGRCYDFADAVLEQLGLDPVWEEYETTHGRLEVMHTEDFWKSEWYIDLRALRRYGEVIPKDLPSKALASLLGRATHAWLKFQGRYYDAETPEGVGHILDMPFFKRQIDGLRADLKQRAASRRTVSEATVKPMAYEVVRLDGPKHESDTIVARTTIHAAGKDDLRAKLKAWMEQIGLDPEDEDDLSCVDWHRVGGAALREGNADKPYVDAHQSGEHTVEIEMMFVPEHIRGTGVGRKTYEEWEAALPSHIHLVTAWAANTGDGKSNMFWEAMGFDYKYVPEGDSEADDNVDFWWWMWKGVNGHPTPPSIPVDTFEDED